MKDILITPDSSGLVEFEFRGSRNDDALMLLQRLYVILLGDNTGEYRDSSIGSTLYPMLGSSNIPSVGVMNSQLALACASALRMLDPEDRVQVSTFNGESTEDGKFIFTLELVDGTSIQGVVHG